MHADNAFVARRSLEKGFVNGANRHTEDEGYQSSDLDSDSEDYDDYDDYFDDDDDDDDETGE